jgi:ribosomal protein RSM22 (predicted rRNA methylase)
VKTERNDIPNVSLFPPLEPDIRRSLESILALIDQVFPIPRRFRAGLPKDIAELSRLLTSNQGDRNESYLSKPSFLSGYLRYFLPWNLYRLCRLLPPLSLNVESGGTITDLGSGPLTFPLALWISRPDLRKLPLEFRCIDRTGSVLDAGKKLFYAFAGGDAPWRIKTIRGSLENAVKGTKADLVSAVNVFNELFRGIPHADQRSLTDLAGKQARILSKLTAESGSILVVEPGVPQSGEIITALRGDLLLYGYAPELPCPHKGLCPFPGGGKTKWCHFAFDTRQAPPALLKLSAAAGLPKERATLSFLLARTIPEYPKKNAFPIRIVSDIFPISSKKFRYGRYGCSGLGIILVTGPQKTLGKHESGGVFMYTPTGQEQRDPKSGALTVVI